MAEFTADQRQAMASNGQAMSDGSYPIPDAEHLGKAIQAVGRGSGSHDAIRKHIIGRAKTLGLSDRIPDGWNADGSVSKADVIKTEITAPLIADQSQQIVYGVVLTPDQVDSQGDTVTAQEIEKAAHKWLVEYRKHDVQHDGNAAAMEPVESFIAPADLSISGPPVLKGAWVIGVHVNDAGTWDRVQKGELTGFSIGGTAERV